MLVVSELTDGFYGPHGCGVERVAQIIRPVVLTSISAAVFFAEEVYAGPSPVQEFCEGENCSLKWSGARACFEADEERVDYGTSLTTKDDCSFVKFFSQHLCKI